MLRPYRQAILTAIRKRGVQLRWMPPTLILNPEDVELDFTIEDLAARHLLEPIPDFFVVQIGAFDGATGDPLHRLIMKYDWNGILVEPQPRPFESLQVTYADRPRLSLRNVAIGERDEVRPFYSVAEGPDWAGQLASFDPQSILRSDRPEAPLADKLVKTDVQCVTFESLLREVDRVDLLQIDVEGFDAVLVRLFDFDRWRPSIVQFEHRHLSLSDHDAAIKRLHSCGYRVAVARYDTLAYKDRRRSVQRP